MEAWLSNLPEWAWAAMAVIAAVLTRLLARRKVIREAKALGLPAPLGGKSCQRCLHWSLREGQNALNQNPAFKQAAGVLSPNEMMASQTDSDGEGNAGRKALPLAENKWQFIGACMGYEEMRHRTDICPHFRSRDIATLQGALPGDGFPAVAREELRAQKQNPDLNGQLDG